MPFPSACPECSSPVRTTAIGGLATCACTKCDWGESGTISYWWPEIPRTKLAHVHVTSSQVDAATLKALRELSPSARLQPVAELKATLTSGAPMLLGLMPELNAAALAKQLREAGLHVSVTALQ